MSPQTETT
uniref:Ribulose-1,5-bisphosphate carboxylase/oxygenase large subunit n=1 Tax=Rubia tinctorum TaxID=29802 RepID=A0A0F7CAG9_RUBTI|nr:ribulose-1,5-bisphosphate carboxylase/oxygenase large subunit [Rubia tinctorum]